MITGRSFVRKTIQKEERKNLNNYLISDDPFLSDSVAYYAVLFEQFLLRNADKHFQRLEEDRQQSILTKELTEFQTAMQYSFNKGHQTAFLILLSDIKNNQEYNIDYFKEPDSQNNFLYTFEKTITEDVFTSNIKRDANDVLINYTRRNFENGYREIMALGHIFFKKGATIAFNQVRKNIVDVDYNITGYSHMMYVPYNQEFEVTPAFKAKFCMETPGFEEWDVFWDATYNAKYANTLIAKILLHSFTAEQIQEYAKVNASAYKLFRSRLLERNNLLNKTKEDELFYNIEINFVLFDPSKSIRLLEEAEYNAIRKSLASKICRKLHINYDHILITH